MSKSEVIICKSCPASFELICAVGIALCFLQALLLGKGARRKAIAGSFCINKPTKMFLICRAVTGNDAAVTEEDDEEHCTSSEQAGRSQASLFVSGQHTTCKSEIFHPMSTGCNNCSASLR